MKPLPTPEDQPYAETLLQLVHSSDSHCWLVYEVKRDFLSAPRGFAMIKIQTEYELDFLPDEQTGELENDYGIARIEAEESEDQQARHYRVALPGLYFDFWGDYQLVEVRYSQLGASTALAEHILSLNTTG